MRKIIIIFLVTIIVAIILVGGYNLYNHYQEQKTNVEKDKMEQDSLIKEYDSSNKKFEQRQRNIDFAGAMTIQKIRLGMSSKNARKYEKHLIDSLNNETDSARDRHMRDDIEKYKREEDSLNKE